MAPAMGAAASDLLTVKEIEVLSKRYEVKSNTRGRVGGGLGGEAEVNYWKLCEQIEKARFPHEAMLREDNVVCTAHNGCRRGLKTPSPCF